VPAENLVGKEGEGFKLAQKWLGIGRLKHGARALGVAERCIEMGASYSKQRVTFGKPLSERQGITFKLADSYVELHAARLMVYQAAWKTIRNRTFATKPTWRNCLLTKCHSASSIEYYRSTAASASLSICLWRNGSSISGAA